MSDTAKLAEAARRMSALADVMVELGGEDSDEVDVCRELAKALVEPGYRNERLTDEVFDRVAAAILGEVESR